jgi:hypothetical protein
VKRAVSIVALVLGSLFAVLAVDAIWVRNLVLNTDRFVAQLGPVIDDPAVQNALVTRVSTSIENAVDLDTRLQQRLPSNLAFLAGPVSDRVDEFIQRVTRTIVQSDQFSAAWHKILRVTHEQVVKTFNGGGRFVKTKDGEITLDLTDLRNKVVAKLQSTGLDVFDKLPAQKDVVIKLADSPGLTKAQNFVKILRVSAWVLPFVALLLFALSVWLALDHRRALTRVGLGIAIGMAVHLIALALGRSFYLDVVTRTLSRDASAAVFDILVKAPRTGTRIMLVVGLLLALVSGLFGPSRAAVWCRGVVTGGANAVGGAAKDLGPIAKVGRFVDAHITAFELSIVALGVIALIAIDQLTATQVLWVGFGVAVALLVVLFLAATGRSGEPTAEPSP